MKICPICGKENDDENVICQCGFNFQGTNFIPGKSESETKNLTRKKPKKDRRKLIITLCVLAAAVLISAIIYGVYSFRTIRWHEKMDAVIYASDEKIMLSDLSRPSAVPFQLAQLKGGEESFIDYEGAFISEDGKKLVFCNNFTETDSFFTVSYDVYCCDLTDLSASPVLIAEGVTNFYMNEDFDTLTYEKMQDGTVLLYQSDLSGKQELIAENFDSYSLSKNGGRIVYSDKNGRLYLKEKGKEKLLSGKNSAFVSADDNFTEIVFRNSKGKLIKTDGEKKKTITKLPKQEKERDTVETYSAEELITGQQSGKKAELLLDGKKYEITVPKGIVVEKFTLSLTEKGNLLFVDGEGGKAYAYKSGRLIESRINVSNHIFPKRAEKVINKKNYDFSVLNGLA